MKYISTIALLFLLSLSVSAGTFAVKKSEINYLTSAKRKIPSPKLLIAKINTHFCPLVGEVRRGNPQKSAEIRRNTLSKTPIKNPYQKPQANTPSKNTSPAGWEFSLLLEYLLIYIIHHSVHFWLKFPVNSQQSPLSLDSHK